MKLTGWATAAVMVMGMAAAAAQNTDTRNTATQNATPQNTTIQNTVRRVIVVSLEDRKLALVEDGQVSKIYPVAVGKPSTPSPVGTFTIERRVVNPVYHHDGKTVEPGPGNPVGTRWMGLSIRGYGIHGTNAPKSIGKAASHGCIRMAKADLEELFKQVEVGDTVEIVGERNEETAQLFGTGEQAAPAAQPVLTVQAPAIMPAIAPAAEMPSAAQVAEITKAVATTAGGTR